MEASTIVYNVKGGGSTALFDYQRIVNMECDIDSSDLHHEAPILHPKLKVNNAEPRSLGETYTILPAKVLSSQPNARIRNMCPMCLERTKPNTVPMGKQTRNS